MGRCLYKHNLHLTSSGWGSVNMRFWGRVCRGLLGLSQLSAWHYHPYGVCFRIPYKEAKGKFCGNPAFTQQVVARLRIRSMVFGSLTKELKITECSELSTIFKPSRRVSILSQTLLSPPEEDMVIPHSPWRVRTSESGSLAEGCPEEV